VRCPPRQRTGSGGSAPGAAQAYLASRGAAFANQWIDAVAGGGGGGAQAGQPRVGGAMPLAQCLSAAQELSWDAMQHALSVINEGIAVADPSQPDAPMVRPCSASPPARPPAPLLERTGTAGRARYRGVPSSGPHHARPRPACRRHRPCPAADGAPAAAAPRCVCPRRFT
jgi:hypothetical protein